MFLVAFLLCVQIITKKNNSQSFHINNQNCGIPANIELKSTTTTAKSPTKNVHKNWITKVLQQTSDRISWMCTNHVSRTNHRNIICIEFFQFNHERQGQFNSNLLEHLCLATALWIHSKWWFGTLFIVRLFNLWSSCWIFDNDRNNSCADDKRTTCEQQHGIQIDNRGIPSGLECTLF